MKMPEGMLPLPCWPTSALVELRDSIEGGVKSGRLQWPYDSMVALDWWLAVTTELEERGKFSLEDAILQKCRTDVYRHDTA